MIQTFLIFATFSSENVARRQKVRGPLSEAMIARFATERLLVGVGTQVLQKMSLEGSLADGALERFHASVVAAEMFAEAVAACEGFGANWARVVALSGVPSHMHLFINKQRLSIIYSFIYICIIVS